ncbi:DUF2530 domain-containing protein [Nocardia sp. CA2R105]|nr:DUF2530 domain-containing protein [Nocardia coffeae]MBY8857691.1 DUF2530 domain-containing protein [Nocardia coffeae]
MFDRGGIVGIVTSDVPEIPPRLTDPRPVLAIGTILWAIATIAVWVNDVWAPARPICLMGLAVGLLGYIIFMIQRRGARRGDKGAQKGL